jgi:elongation factor G
MIPWLTPPHLNYRQSIQSKGIGERKIIRQTGGVAQYAHVELSVEPLVGAMGIQFTENVTPRGALPREFLSYLELGVVSASKNGLWGFPVGGILVYIQDGSYHDVDSTAAVFEEVAAKAFKSAMVVSHPVILEPTVSCMVSVPEEYMPAVFGELNQRRFLITKTRKIQFHEIEGIVPQSEVLDLLPHLAVETRGTAYCSMHPEGYEKLPESLTAEFYCTSCERDMRIPLLNNIPITEKCLICGAVFHPPDDLSDFNASVPVLKR